MNIVRLRLHTSQYNSSLAVSPQPVATNLGILAHHFCEESTFLVVVWILSSLPPGVDYGSSDSYLGRIGHFIAPLFKPAGFGFYQAAVALIAGIMAKEQVVSTLGTLFGADLKTILSHYFNPVSAYAFMVMSLIYIPCIATIATIKQEIGWRWAIFTTTYTLILGYILATMLYQIGSLIFL